MRFTPWEEPCRLRDDRIAGPGRSICARAPCGSHAPAGTTTRRSRSTAISTVVGEFADSFGEDGTIFGLPDTHIQLEIVRARGGVIADDPLDMLVLYLPGAAAVVEATEPLRTAGVPTDPTPHPYWVARGGIVHVDPDGRRVVFAPWVYGDEPEPAGSQG